VKLLPMEVSNADGKDVVTTVTDGKVVPVLVLVGTDDPLESVVDASVVVGFAEFAISVVDAADSSDVVAVGSAPDSVVVGSASLPSCLL